MIARFGLDIKSRVSLQTPRQEAVAVADFGQQVAGDSSSSAMLPDEMPYTAEGTPAVWLPVFPQVPPHMLVAVRQSEAPRNGPVQSRHVVPNHYKRKVNLHNYESKRAKLLAEGKPVYNYKPKILKEYSSEEYLKHKALYMKSKHAEKIAELQKKFYTTASAPPVDNVFKDRIIESHEVNIGVLKKQIKPYHLTDIWYLVVDTKVLLEDMFFIEKLMKSDKNCRLHLPYEVLHDLTAMTHRRQPAWIRIPARRVIQFYERLLIFGRGQTPLEAEDVQDSPVAFDSVINCCLQLMKRYFYVVLISSDSERRVRADFVELPCYTLEHVKKQTCKELVTMTFKNTSFDLFRPNGPIQ